MPGDALLLVVGRSAGIVAREYVASIRVERDGLAKVAGDGGCGSLGDRRIAAHAWDGLAEDGREVLADDHLSVGGVDIDEVGPSASHARAGEGQDVRVGFARPEPVLEEAGKAHFARGLARLEQRHGVHAQPADAPRTAMGPLFVAWGGGPRENPPPLSASRVVHRMAHHVPQLRNPLPLVHDVRGLACEREGRVCLGYLEVCAAVDVRDAPADHPCNTSP